MIAEILAGRTPLQFGLGIFAVDGGSGLSLGRRQSSLVPSGATATTCSLQDGLIARTWLACATAPPFHPSGDNTPTVPHGGGKRGRHLAFQFLLVGQLRGRPFQEKNLIRYTAVDLLGFRAASRLWPAVITRRCALPQLAVWDFCRVFAHARAEFSLGNCYLK